MQSIRKASRRLPVPAFVAAALAFGAMAMPPAHATNPFDESFAGGIRLIGLINNVDVEITVMEMIDPGAAKVRIRWALSNEDSSLADKRNGYCMRVKFPDEGWQEECFSETPASATTSPQVSTYYWGDMTIEFPHPGIFWVAAQVKMEYGTGGYTSWSSEHSEWLQY